jgi:hypothetical protein
VIDRPSLVIGDKTRIIIKIDDFESASSRKKINARLLTFGGLSWIYPKRPARLLGRVSLKIIIVS